MNVAVSCGGTGGHMFPGLAVAAALRRRGHRVAVILSGRAVEAERAKADLPEGAEAMLVPVDPISPRRPKSLLKLVRAVRTARREFRAFRPDVLLAMGSYTSIAPVLAARTLGVPVVLHEANAIPGSAVAHLARFARTVCVCFPDMARFFPKGARLADTGLPLRAEFEKGVGGSRADPAKFSLLVMGGSQGAKAVNRAVVEALALLPSRHPELAARIRVVHLAGTRNEEEVRALYAEKGLAGAAFEVLGFEHDMSRRYAEADLCVSRAGASSCFELALTGLPAVFVPLPGLARDHQSRNAESMAARGAGVVAPQASLSPESLADLLASLSADAPRRAAMRESLLAAARPDAASRVADEVERNARRASDE